MAPLVEVSDLTFTFAGTERPALRRVSLRIMPDDFLVITGPSGCGKSTLALAIGGYLFQQYDGIASGTVIVAGQDAQTSPVYQIADVVGLVQQDPEAQFCTLTVQDELAFGLENQCLPRSEIWERIAWALDVVGAPHLMARHLRTLSGGEKQKVAIAAVVATRPQVLILDEPTSNLDPQATADLFEVIAGIQAATHCAIVIIEHKLDYLRAYDPRGLLMCDGAIVASEAQLGAQRRPRPQARRQAPERALPMPTAAVFEIQALTVRTGERSILDNIAVSAGPGEAIAVMGDNGSGKTTLLRCLLGLRQPTLGTVSVLGRDTASTPVSTLAKDIGFVFQNPNHQLFADTVWEEATMALEAAGSLDAQAERRVRDLLQIAGLADRLADHPYRLSLGEKRRLNVVSVLGHRPRLLLLDEIFIGQDMQNVSLLLRLLDRAINCGATVVLVNHSPEVTAKFATRLLFLASGCLIIDAPVQEGLAALIDCGLGAYAPASHRAMPSDHAQAAAEDLYEANRLPTG